MSTRGWNRISLAGVCAGEDDIKCGPFGTQLARDEFRPEGVPLWGIKHVNANFRIPTHEFLETRTAERLQQYDLRPLDIVMTRKGTVGNCAIYPPGFSRGVMHSDLLRLRVDRSVCHPEFLVHQLHSSPDVASQLLLISGGAIMPGVNVGRLKKLIVWLPPLAEQRRIADVLDRAEALRAKRRAALDQVEELTESIFVEAFGRPGMNPMGWPVVPLCKLCEPKQWPTISGAQLTPTGYPVFGANGLIGCYSSYNHPDPTVLITCRGATCGTINICPPKCYVTGNAMALDDPDPNRITIDYLAAVLSFRRLTDAISGSAQPQITKQSLEQVTIPLPPVALQREFSRRVAAVKTLKAAHRSSLGELDALFASLQHRAFRGEL